jgi:hypothetical protein
MVHPDPHASPVILTSPPTSLGQTNGVASATDAVVAKQDSSLVVHLNEESYPNSTTALSTAKAAGGVIFTVTGTNVDRITESFGGNEGILSIQISRLSWAFKNAMDQSP